MKEYVLTPNAASLSQSMRDIGYSLETAIADLIDNSITAGASIIDVNIRNIETDQACLAVIDDGCGMTKNEGLEAMRPGSANPRHLRDADDLGRFGLGLKTASFSQCRQLTLISRRDSHTFAATWDLDVIAERNEWIVQVLSPDEVEQLPLVDSLGEEGTCILWRKMDRLLENQQVPASSTRLHDKLEHVERHLALIYHRFLSGEIRNRKITIRINGHVVKPFDPFCTAHRATQVLSEEIVRIQGEEIRIQPFILPHHSKLGPTEYDYYRDRSDFITHQGAYIYRGGRLMAWGDWFRLVPKTEATKLARVRIDFPNALDELWTIDIKKSRAQPPLQVREKMRQIITRITDQSRRVHVGRGDRLFAGQHHRIWERYPDRSGIVYGINRTHPLFEALADVTEPATVRQVMQILSVIESEIPVEAIYADYSNTPQRFEERPEVPPEMLRESIGILADLFRTGGKLNREGLSSALATVESFRHYADVVQKIIEELV